MIGKLKGLVDSFGDDFVQVEKVARKRRPVVDRCWLGIALLHAGLVLRVDARGGRALK